MTDGSLLSQSALPARKIGFFNRLRIVLLTRSAIEGSLPVNLEKCCIIFIFKKF